MQVCPIQIYSKGGWLVVLTWKRDRSYQMWQDRGGRRSVGKRYHMTKGAGKRAKSFRVQKLATGWPQLRQMWDRRSQVWVWAREQRGINNVINPRKCIRVKMEHMSSSKLRRNVAIKSKGCLQSYPLRTIRSSGHLRYIVSLRLQDTLSQKTKQNNKTKTTTTNNKPTQR